MSRIWKRILIILGAATIIVIIGLAYSYYVMNYYNPDLFEVAIDQQALTYYHDDYSESREAFISQSRELQGSYDSVIIFKTPVESSTDTGLYIDYCFFPGIDDPDRLLILSSGIHGIEGFAGSAVQIMFMEEFLDKGLLKNTAVLFIHGLNPYGFKHFRRFTENNVDLNRNWDTDKSLFATPNPGYFRFTNMINPSKKVNLDNAGNRFFFLKAIIKMITNNIEFARQSILQGQYEYQDGLYFGGMDFEPQVHTVRTILEDICEPYQVIFHIDLHTGYGQWGTLHFFPNPVKDPLAKQNLEKIFTEHEIDWGDEEKFYTITGGFPTFVGKLNQGKLFLPMTFEYGTMDSHTTFGSIKSLQIIINENQGHHHGYVRDRDSTIIIEQFINMYYPQSEAWQTRVIQTSREAFNTLLPRYYELSAKR